MFKDFSEIEPIQKNSIVVLAALFCLSYLQLKIFDNRIETNEVFPSIILSLALSICWIVINFVPLYLFFEYLSIGMNKSKTKYEMTVFFFGYISLLVITVIMYICYELEFDFKKFIRISIGIYVLITVVIYYILKNARKSQV